MTTPFNALSDSQLDELMNREERAKNVERLGAAPRLVPISWGKLDALPKREPLIEGLLDVGTMSAIIGASGSYKTGIAIDLAAHIALGRPWRGHWVKKGVPLYLAVEGGWGIAERLEAWRQYHCVGPNEGDFYVIPEPIDLAHGDTDTKLLIQRINAMSKPVDFIGIDTVSRAMSGGDENSSKDLGTLVRNCDLIREATRAHVCGLHHLGKEEGRGARGHSLLKAALDTELTTTKNGRVGSLEVTKQRDKPDGQRFGFAIEVVRLDVEKQSYVVVPADNPPPNKASRWTRALTIFRDSALAAILDHGQEHRLGTDGPTVKAVPSDDIRNEHKRLYVHNGDGDRVAAERQAWSRAIKTARGSNLIGSENLHGRDFVWLVAP